MCYHKSITEKFEELQAHYAASFDSITAELEPIRERFVLLMKKDGMLGEHSLAEADQIRNILTAYSQKDALPAVYSKPELTELKWCLKTLTAFTGDSVLRFHENGFDYLPTPIVTAGEPDNFKLFNWGLIPFYMKEKQKALELRAQTLNCISEEMYDKPSFRDAIKNGQRCLIPISGFYEWRWLDEKGTVKIPYYITFRDGKPRSIGGLYSRWKDPETGVYNYTYTVLTTRANAILEYVHNNKKRMPVIIDKENEKAWLDRDLKKEDVLELCRPSQDHDMRAYTISKLLTTKDINTNVPEVREPMNYNAAVEEASRFLESGDRKKALEVFKALVAQSATNEKAIKIEHLEVAAREKIAEELALS